MLSLKARTNFTRTGKSVILSRWVKPRDRTTGIWYARHAETKQFLGVMEIRRDGYVWGRKKLLKGLSTGITPSARIAWIDDESFTSMSIEAEYQRTYLNWDHFLTLPLMDKEYTGTPAEQSRRNEILERYRRAMDKRDSNSIASRIAISYKDYKDYTQIYTPESTTDHIIKSLKMSKGMERGVITGRFTNMISNITAV